MDNSTVATDRLKAQNSDINVICTDPHTWDIPQIRYDLISYIRFLDRRLFILIQEGLKPGGVLIIESFLDSKTDPYCLKQNELFKSLQSYRVVYYEEQKLEDSRRFDQTASFAAVKTLPT